jgi:hypothetical protein
LHVRRRRPALFFGRSAYSLSRWREREQIGRIEVRAEDSIDIRQYIHKKSFDLRVLPLGKNLSDLRDKWIALMRPFHGPLLAAKLIYQKDPALLSPYGVQQAYQKINQLPGGRQANGKYFPMIKTLAAMARAIEYLTVQSVTSFESVVKDLQQSGSKALVQQPAFRDFGLASSPGLRRAPQDGDAPLDLPRALQVVVEPRRRVWRQARDPRHDLLQLSCGRRGDCRVLEHAKASDQGDGLCRAGVVQGSEGQVAEGATRGELEVNGAFKMSPALR